MKHKWRFRITIIEIIITALLFLVPRLRVAPNGLLVLKMVGYTMFSVIVLYRAGEDFWLKGLFNLFMVINFIISFVCFAIITFIAYMDYIIILFPFLKKG